MVRRDGTRPSHVAHGVIDTDTTASIAVRLCQIERELDAVVASTAHRVGGRSALLRQRRDRRRQARPRARRGALGAGARRPAHRRVRAHAREESHRRPWSRGQAADRHDDCHDPRLPAPPRSDAADALAIALAHVQASRMEAHLARARALRPGGGPSPHPKTPTP